MKYLASLFLAFSFLIPFTASAALADNLVSYYNLDESSGNAADLVGSNTLVNSNVTYSTGIVNNGAVFDSSTDKLTVTDAGQSGLDFADDFSISAWINVTATGRNHGIVSKGDNGAYQYLFWVDPGNKLVVDISQDGSQTASQYHRQISDAAQISSTATWYHVGMTMDLGLNTIILYVNGASVASSVGYGSGVTAINNGAGDFSLGYENSFPNKLAGTLDEVGLWSRVLTSSEMTSLYNSGSACAHPFTACEGGAATLTPIIGLIRSFWLW